MAEGKDTWPLERFLSIIAGGLLASLIAWFAYSTVQNREDIIGMKGTLVQHDLRLKQLEPARR